MNTINLLSDARFFDDSNTRLHQLRTQLDSKSTKDKLEAMKSLIAHMTLGRDMSAFFPDVVKNVIVESQEVKKLVYMFLITYSEHNQDLALLSINTFQKDLASPSQRIRANAMKAMSAIRIPVAIPLVMLALKSAVKDNSSYVRRAAACAIPKLHSDDTEGDHYDELVSMVDELLSSIDPVVLGSALFAFNVVCPARWDLLHRQYRKVCHLLADFDEWGQCVALDVLCRYGRTQFLSPFAREADNSAVVAGVDDGRRGDNSSSSKSKHAKATAAQQKKKKKAKNKSDKFYSDEESSESASDHSESELSSEEEEEEVESSVPTLDDDHLLLLRQSQSLLYSSNAAVILAIATLHWYLAPSQLCTAIMPALIRLCRNKRSVQYVLLTNTLTMCKARPALFTPYIKDFYVNVSDAAYVKQLKLEILSYIVNDDSVVSLVRELTVYAHDSDTAFVCAAISCVGRCAVRLPAVADKCLQLLMRLVTSPVDAVVAEAVVTIRQLLQSQSSHHTTVVKRMARLLDRVRAPMARSAIVWMVGEYRELIPRMAADCLRKLSLTFRDEHETVKLQILNLAVKLYLWRPKDVSLLFKYVMDMSKYDLSYDIRDRARLMRALFFKKKDTAATTAATSLPASTGSEVKETLKQLFLIPKPPPTVDDNTAAHDRYTLGTLSQTLGVVVSGYSELPDFPLIAPSSEVRKPLEEYEAEERRERERKRAMKRRGRGGGRGESESEEDGSDSERSEREDESDFSEFDASDDDRSDSPSDRSDSGSDSDHDRSENESDNRSKRREAVSKTERNKRGSTRRERSESESEEESSEKSESDDSRERDRRGRRRRGGRDRESESESESRSEVDSEEERRKRKQKEKEKDKDRMKAEKEREREKEKEKEKASKKREEEKKEKEKESKDKSSKGGKEVKKAGKVNVGDLLDLSDLTALASSTVVSQPSLPPNTNPISPTAASSSSSSSSSTVTSPRSTATALSGLSIPSRGQRGQLLNPITSGGLRVDYTFSRRPSLYGKRFIAVDLLYVNESTAPFTSTALSEEDSVNETASEGTADVEAMGQLEVGQQHTVKLQVDFKGRIQPRVWRVSIAGGGDYAVRITPDVGELVRPALLSTAEWEAKARRLSGMSEHKLDVSVSDVDVRSMAQLLLAVCNMAVLAGSSEEAAVGGGGSSVLRLSGQRLDDDDWVLLKLAVRSASSDGNSGRMQLIVHCEDFMFGTSLADAAKKGLS